MNEYPKVQSEKETIWHLLQTGQSLARYGDGEVKMMRSVGNKYEDYDPRIRRCLLHILEKPQKNVAIGIPNPLPGSPRFEWWQPFVKKMTPFLRPDVQYFSSFITRADQAPWIAHEEQWYRAQIERLWWQKRTVLVGSGSSLTAEDMKDASELLYIKTTGRNDFGMYDEIEAQILAYSPEVVVLCAGMMATCMVPPLAARGIRAYDLGAFGNRKLWRIGREIQESLK